MTVSGPRSRTHVPHKWGFGMAPPRPHHLERWDAAVTLVLRYLNDEREALGRRHEVAAALSEAKGLFARCWKNDQWDWFVVYTRLGSPTNRLARGCSHALGSMAGGLRAADQEMVDHGRAEFTRWGGRHWLHRWASEVRPLDEGWGFVYVLSTRDEPDMLKVGFTTRPVEQRVAEINAATGLAVPYGARRAWRVRDARSVEALVHEALGEFRVRPDREFFMLNHRDAIKMIDQVVAHNRLEA